MKKELSALFFVFFFIYSFQARAQFEELVAQYGGEFDTTGFVFYAPNSLQAQESFSIFESYFPNTNLGLELVEEFEDEILHMTHYKFQETFHGLTIEGAQHTEHADNDYIVYSNSKFVLDLDVFYPDPTPVVGELEALGQILLEYPSNTFAWDDSLWESQIIADLQDSLATNYPEGELIFAVENPDQRFGFIIPGAEYVLAWRFEVISADPFFSSRNIC
jgi:hypothetical protein